MLRTLLVSLVLLPLSAFAQNFDTVKIRPFKVSENLYMLTGSGGNMGVLTGPEGILMIDDQYAPLSDKIRDAIRQLDPGEIKYVINTHLHGDHTGGNENFRKLGTTLLAHDNVRERMMKETMDRQNKPVPPRNKDAWPAVTFSSTLNIHLNDEDIELIYMDRGHTDGDVMVHFKNANVFHMGDTYRNGYPYIDLSSGGSFPGFIHTLEMALTHMDNNSKVIPGHGKLGTKADVKAYYDKMSDIRNQVVAALKNGTKVEDIPGMGITEKYDTEWGNGFIKGKDFVMMVAEQMKVTAELKK